MPNRIPFIFRLMDNSFNLAKIYMLAIGMIMLHFILIISFSVFQFVELWSINELCHPAGKATFEKVED